MGMLFIFKGKPGETLMLRYDEDATSVDTLFKEAVDNFNGSGVANAVLEGSVKDMTVNNNLARYGVYGGTMSSDGMEIKMYGALGAILMRDGGGLWTFGMMSESSRKSLEKALEKTFQGIRVP